MGKSTGDYLRCFKRRLGGIGLYYFELVPTHAKLNNAAEQCGSAGVGEAENAADLRLQELKTATDLVEPLLSADKRKRQIALIMLPHTVSDGVMSRQILLIATQDQDSDVRLTALHQMGQSTQASVAVAAAKTIKRAVSACCGTGGGIDRSRPGITAGRSSDELDCVFASMPGAKAYDSPELGGGIYTSALLKGLTQQSLGSTGQVTTSELGYYLRHEVASLSSKYIGTIFPAYIQDESTEDVPVLAAKAGQRVFALVVGVGRYESRSIPSIPYADSDADKVASLFRSSGVIVSLLHDPTRASFLAGDWVRSVRKVEFRRQVDLLLFRSSIDVGE